jgi:hypothetical protein
MSELNDETWKASDVSDNEVTNPEMSKSMYLSESEDVTDSHNGSEESSTSDKSEKGDDNTQLKSDTDNDDANTEEDDSECDEDDEDDDDEEYESDNQESEEGEYISESEEDYDIKRANNIIILKIPVEKLKEPEFPGIITGVALTLCALWMFRVITLLCSVMNDSCKQCRPICN